MYVAHHIAELGNCAVGVCVFSQLNYVDLNKCWAYDALHSFLFGVTDLVMKLLIGRPLSSNPYASSILVLRIRADLTPGTCWETQPAVQGPKEKGACQEPINTHTGGSTRYLNACDVA